MRYTTPPASTRDLNDLMRPMTQAGSSARTCRDTRVLILAGDVSSEPSLLQATLQSLAAQNKTFDWLFFCHGSCICDHSLIMHSYLLDGCGR